MKNVTAEELTTVPMTMTVQEYTPMLLMNTAFEPGTCMEFLESLTDPDVKKMAYAEYYYFSGQHEKAVEYASPYLNHENAMVRMSACLICSLRICRLIISVMRGEGWTACRRAWHSMNMQIRRIRRCWHL